VTDGEEALTDGSEIRSLLEELYAARVRSDLDRLCRVFSPEATFKIAGISHHVSQIAVAAVGIYEIRQCLALLLKTSRLHDQVIITTIIEDDRAAVHWRAKIYSRFTGITVPTELVDLVEVADGHVVSFTEFLAPCR
jgi:ketosteroid isomerase-like protein